MIENSFTVKDIGDGIYSVSSPMWLGEGVNNPYAPVMQSYVVAGEENCLVIDTPAPDIPGFFTFLSETFKRPIIYANTHGHIDHTGCSTQFGTAHLSPLDFSLVQGDGIRRGNGAVTYQMLPLSCWDKINLGGRKLAVISLPGHTLGSIGFWDENTKTLFSGDAISRRVLYGITDSVPLEDYFSALEAVSLLKPERIYSAHDYFALGGNYNEKILKTVKDELHKTNRVWVSPVDGSRFVRILTGSENEENFFDFTILEEIVVR